MTATRPRPTLLTVSDAAAEKARALLARAEDGATALRIGVRKGGCSGFEYKIEYATEAAPGEEVVEDKGVTLLIEPTATMFLLGCEMDWKDDKFSSGFDFKNPNETGRCGCGESIAF